MILAFDARQWRLLALVCGAFLIARFDLTLLTLSLPQLQSDFRIAEDAVGPFVSVARLGGIAALPVALLADRLGRRKLLLGTVLGLGLSSLLAALAPNWPLFAAAQFACRGFGMADEILSIIVIVEEFDAEKRAIAVGLMLLISGLGEALALLSYPLVANLPEGWRILYGMGAVLLLPLALLRRNLLETAHFRQTANDPAFRSRTAMAQLWNVRRVSARLAIVAAIYHLPVSVTAIFMSKFLQETHRFTPLDTSTLFLGVGLFSVFGSIAGPWFADRLGRCPAFSVASALYAGGYLIFYLMPAQWAYIGYFLGSFGFLASHAIFFILAGEALPTVSRATVAGFLQAVAALAVASGLVLEGLLYRLTLDHGTAIGWLIPAALIGSLFAWVMVPETNGKKLENFLQPG